MPYEAKIFGAYGSLRARRLMQAFVKIMPWCQGYQHVATDSFCLAAAGVNDAALCNTEAFCPSIYRLKKSRRQ